jgi:threonine/homoserine/homoserine lactone efflux protein
MEFLTYFLLAAIVSFAGSCQPGPVNMAVLLASTEKQFNKALYIAIGGSLPEAFYAFVAIYASAFIIGYQQFLEVVAQGFSIAFIVIGIYLFLRKAKLAVPQKGSSKNGIGLGIMISAVNPQLILFWIAVITSMELHAFHLTVAHPFTQFGFLLGSSMGAFLLHYILVILCKRYQQSSVLELFSLYSNKIVGCVFAILGLGQLVFG